MMVTKQFQKRFCCLVLLLASWKQIRNGDCQLTTGGTFFERFDETLFGESESNNDAETVSTVEHHYCAINDQCEFVVDQENADSTMKQTSISDKKDLKSIESNAVIWKKKTKNVFRDCKEAYENGFRESGQIKILRDKEGNEAQASCDMVTDGGGWTVFQRRVNSSVDFQRNWADYKKGFGDTASNFWLGLDTLNFLTSSSRKVSLRIDLRNTTGAQGYAKYAGFSVDNEGNNYQLKLNYSGGDIGDSMGPNNEMFFSTSDKDNDQDGTVNMASFAMGAWWYGPNGYFSNLNNMFSSPNVMNQPLLYAMSWRTWGNKYGGLSFSEMKLRREA